MKLSHDCTKSWIQVQQNLPLILKLPKLRPKYPFKASLLYIILTWWGNWQTHTVHWWVKDKYIYTTQIDLKPMMVRYPRYWYSVRVTEAKMVLSIYGLWKSIKIAFQNGWRSYTECRMEDCTCVNCYLSQKNSQGHVYKWRIEVWSIFSMNRTKLMFPRPKLGQCLLYALKGSFHRSSPF